MYKLSDYLELSTRSIGCMTFQLSISIRRFSNGTPNVNPLLIIHQIADQQCLILIMLFHTNVNIYELSYTQINNRSSIASCPSTLSNTFLNKKRK